MNQNQKNKNNKNELSWFLWDFLDISRDSRHIQASKALLFTPLRPKTPAQG